MRREGKVVADWRACRANTDRWKICVLKADVSYSDAVCQMLCVFGHDPDAGLKHTVDLSRTFVERFLPLRIFYTRSLNC